MTRRVGLVFAGLFAATLFAQPPGAAQPAAKTPIVVTLLPYVHDEGFAKDLKLSPEQVKQLVDHRQKQWDEAYTTAPAAMKALAERNAATAAVIQKVLTPEQYARAVQLAAGQQWRSNNLGVGFGGAPAGAPAVDTTKVIVTVLATYPEVAAALNLTDDQKQLAANGYTGIAPTRRPVVFLTPEQAKTAKAFLGEPAKVNWNFATDPRGRFGGSTVFGGRLVQGPAILALIDAKAVRAEIGLTDDQNKALEPIRARWESLTADTRDLSIEARNKKRDELQAETDKALATLKPEQLARLRQIERQQSGGRFGGGFGVGEAAEPLLSFKINTPAVSKALAITPEQTKAMQAADKALADAVTAAALADGPVEAAEKAIAAATAAREKAYAAVLTDTQKKTLDDFYGKWFAGNTTSDRLATGGGPGGGPASDRNRTMRAALFGRYVFTELRLLAENKSIQDELTLTAEQIKKATAADTEFQGKFGRGIPVNGAEEAAKERSAFNTKAIADILKPEQAKRFTELMLQRAEQIPTGPGPRVGSVGVPGVAEAIKLTEAQKTDILDGKNPDEVLTADQKAKIKEMMGKPYSGGFAVSPPAGGFGGRDGPTVPPVTAGQVLVVVPWDVFKITPEQVTKLVPVMNKYQLETVPIVTKGPPVGEGGFGGGLTTRADPAKQAAANDMLAKALAATLTPEQVKRIEQVRYQLLAASAGTFRQSYFTNPEVVKTLGLSPEQITKITATRTELQRLQSAVQVALDFAQSQEITTKLDEKQRARALAVLTDAQRAKWKDLTGDPVPNLPRISPFGPFGGPGL